MGSLGLKSLRMDESMELPIKMQLKPKIKMLPIHKQMVDV